MERSWLTSLMKIISREATLVSSTAANRMLTTGGGYNILSLNYTALKKDKGGKGLLPVLLCFTVLWFLHGAILNMEFLCFSFSPVMFILLHTSVVYCLCVIMRDNLAQRIRVSILFRTWNIMHSHSQIYALAGLGVLPLSETWPQTRESSTNDRTTAPKCELLCWDCNCKVLVRSPMPYNHNFTITITIPSSTITSLALFHWFWD